MSAQNALKLLFELRAVLDRLGEADDTLREAIAHDVDRAIGLTNSCIAQLTQEDAGASEDDEEEGD